MAEDITHHALSREEEAQQNFLYESWLQQFPLNRVTVMDYFKWSPFYDRNSNNEYLASQNLPMSHLSQMNGLAYILVCEGNELECPYYLIYKQNRYSDSDNDTELLRVYYVIGEDVPADPTSGRNYELRKGTVIPMPDLHTVLTFNTRAAIHHISKAVDGLQKGIKLESQHPIVHTEAASDSAFAQPVSDASAVQFMATFAALKDSVLMPLLQAAEELQRQEAAASSGSSAPDTDTVTRE